MSNRKSYMNRQGILKEGFLENIFKLLLKGRINKVQRMFDNNPHLEKATKQYKKAQDDYVKILKKQGYKY